MQRVTISMLLMTIILGASCKKSSENATEAYRDLLGAWKLMGTTGGFGQLLVPYPQTEQYIFLNTDGTMTVYNGKDKKTEKATFIIYEQKVCGMTNKSTMLHTSYNSGTNYIIKLNNEGQLTIGSPECVNDGGVNIFERTYLTLPAGFASKQEQLYF
ncbi:hypothetical protein LL912_18075 [Niabella sp. CC-SYL272]|uniref:hypothetical protein n=1 Tax=Niabella agricola TaxID=2891571 RepID=UPI001F256D96|nr:hypothetical protein [Niabella agricola]MCF3110696.1 hypothetical protein [Niabella agricola]